MNKELAREIVGVVVSFDAQLGELYRLISRIEDEDERKRYAKALGHLRHSRARPVTA